ncbi:CvpA family protein [Deferribacterales bacterium Es71-Z0220]|uniref:CvpA family protein n=1 Tax=Deferrivibrio essentukiensis TaxID=2880922 RepID=UPI001F610635|nr:CvpA family protein [Deferrivibrio essentukiensis]MCB4204227.1 CvpA family protein [Deferrivibrio essentukiensis]
MEITDIILLIIIGVFAVKGLLKGLINEAFGILGLILGYVVSFQIYTPIAKIINGMGLSDKVAGAVGFVLAFLIIYIALLIIGKLLARFFKAIKLGWADRTLGALFGALKSAVILSIILSVVISFTPRNSEFAKKLEKNYVSGNLLKLTPYVFDVLNKLPKDKKKNPFKNESLLDKFK